MAEQTAADRLRRALPSAEYLADQDKFHFWVFRHTGKHAEEHSADELAALKAKRERDHTVAVDPADVIAHCRPLRLAGNTDPIVRDLHLGSLRAGNAPEVHILARQLRHILDQSAPPPAPAEPAAIAG